MGSGALAEICPKANVLSLLLLLFIYDLFNFVTLDLVSGAKTYCIVEIIFLKAFIR